MVSSIISSENIVSLQTLLIPQWKIEGIHHAESDFLDLVVKNHAFNFTLWHAEDRARRDDMGAQFVKDAKREIDKANQARNNAIEAMDIWLCNALKPIPSTHCPVHSETPGMMIDRLSILALKCYHMYLQTEREDESAEHRERCLQKYQVLKAQQSQLAACLDALLEAVKTKTRTFVVYHQFKMYNDPSLNPELYNAEKEI